MIRVRSRRVLNTFLCSLIQAKDLVGIQYFFEREFDIVWQDDELPHTALQFAIFCRSHDIVRLLLHLRYPVNLISSHGNTALHCAVNYGDQTSTVLLVQSGADIDCKTFHGSTPLMIAMINHRYGLVHTLLSLKASPNVCFEDGDSVLMYAASIGNKGFVRSLLDAKADINYQSPDGYTALIIAANKSHYKVGQLLLKRGANTKLCTKPPEELWPDSFCGTAMEATKSSWFQALIRKIPFVWTPQDHCIAPKKIKRAVLTVTMIRDCMTDTIFNLAPNEVLFEIFFYLRYR